MNIKESLSEINQRIVNACHRSQRNPADITVIAVTKYVSMQTTEAVFKEGIHHIGESKVQDAMPKWETLGGGVDWHFIGNLQTNKVKEIIGKFSYIHSLDRPSLMKEIERRGKQQNVITNCFIQVNVSGEETKSGIDPNQVLEFVKETSKMNYIKICGLMTMAPYELDSEQTRPIFRKLRQLKDECNQIENVQIEHLSMGMSNDFEIAIEEGATFVRLGSSLVGTD